MSRFTAEQKFLQMEATRVWSDLSEAKSLDVPWGEETITDIFIKELRKSYPGTIDVIPFNKHTEGASGADWIWSFMNVAESTSMTMLVQAKLLDRDEVAYSKLGHKIGKIDPKVLQIERLIKSANTMGISALYAFYNHISDNTRIPNNCISLDMRDPDHSPGYGISLATAQNVLKAFPDFEFDVQSKHSFPLHCLLCGPLGGFREGNGDSPTTILNVLVKLEQKRKRERKEELKRQKAEQAQVPEILGFRDSPHALVISARRNRQALAAGVDPRSFELPEVAGIITFTDREKKVDALA